MGVTKVVFGGGAADGSGFSMFLSAEGGAGYKRLSEKAGGISRGGWSLRERG